MKYFLISFILFTFAACTTDDGSDAQQDQPFTAHGETSDFDAVVVRDSKGDETLAVFDEDSIVSDSAYTDSSLTAVQIQGFLEHTPYNKPTWLANTMDDGTIPSELIHAAAVKYEINPIMILARFQVEGSHISKTATPSIAKINKSLGCGCFDGQSCQTRYSGLEKQIDCAAKVLRTKFDESVDGTGTWVKGVSKQTLDPMQVTPESHATAALYAYTPWVLKGTGGNWLVWNISQRYLAHIPSTRAWIGDECLQDSDCNFNDGEGNPAFCYDFIALGVNVGICTVPCEGYCPDRTGESSTFCVASDTEGIGICVETPDSTNNSCNDIPGMETSSVERFVGTSEAPDATKEVCLPTPLLDE